MEPWLAELERCRPETAWDLFIGRYRRLIFATIQRHVQDPDEVMDVFTGVCEVLRHNEMARVRRYGQEQPNRARFSTWLAAVVRNLAIDKLRATHGRRRLPAVARRLSPLQQRILRHVFVHQRGHREAYELVRAAGHELSFGAFLKELAEVYRVVQAGRRGSGRRNPDGQDRAWDVDGCAETGHLEGDPLTVAETRAILDGVLRALAAEDRAAIQLYVVEGLGAAEVARVLALPNRKAVYNRVYRALVTVRERLEEAGYRHAGDF